MNKLKYTILTLALVFISVGVYQTHKNLNIKITWGMEQQPALYAARLPDFQLPNHKVQTSKQYAEFLNSLEDKIDAGE